MATTLICNHLIFFMECACNWELGGTVVLKGTAGSGTGEYWLGGTTG